MMATGSGKDPSCPAVGGGGGLLQAPEGGSWWQERPWAGLNSDGRP